MRRSRNSNQVLLLPLLYPLLHAHSGSLKYSSPQCCSRFMDQSLLEAENLGLAVRFVVVLGEVGNLGSGHKFDGGDDQLTMEYVLSLSQWRLQLKRRMIRMAHP